MRRLIVGAAATLIVTAFSRRAYAFASSNHYIGSNGNFNGIYYRKKVKRSHWLPARIIDAE